jgi:protoheme IX farnesyltransferase
VSVLPAAQPTAGDRTTASPDRLGAAEGVAATVRAYVALTKPRIIELLLVTTVPVMFLAAGGLPPLWPVVATLVGGTLVAGSANAINCYIDRDIDEVMRRTRKRPLATHAVDPAPALVFGIVLGALATAWLAITVNLLSAGLALAANLFYVFVYSLLLKRRTSQNIVWGGLAGCFPTLIGWTAITGELAWPPVVLFLVVFFWTPPHSWVLAMRYREDYAAAKVPMLPVVASERTVLRRIVAYSWLMVATSLLLWPVAGTGWLYPAVAVVVGVGFLAGAHRMLGRVRAGVTGAALAPMQLFHASNVYLAVLFLAVAVDPLLF